MSDKKMNVIQMPLSDIKRPERNIRFHPEKQMREYERSIAMFGQLRPIVVDEANVILCGVGLHEALKRMGKESASVIVAGGLNQQQKKKLMIADNKIYSLGIDDLGSLDKFLLELKGDYDIPGYDEDVLKSLMAEVKNVESVISSYGTLDQEEIQSMQASGARKDTAISESNAPPAPKPEYSPAPEQKRLIVCPHCGEEIWL